MKKILILLCVSATLIVGSVGLAHAYSIEPTYYYEGVDLEPGYPLYQDPTVLIVIKGQQSSIENSIIPESLGDFAGFDSYENGRKVDFFFGYDSDAGEFTITVRDDNQNTNIEGMFVGDISFDDVDPIKLDFDDLVNPFTVDYITAQSVVVFETADHEFFKLGNFELNDWAVKFDILKIDPSGVIVPEPSTLLLLGLGLLALVGIGCRRTNMKRTAKYFLLVVIVGTAGLLFSGAEPAAAQSVYDCSEAEGITETECDALVALYANTNGDNWKHNNGWLETNNPCNWYGVTCPSGNVMQISLPGNNLTGTLPGNLGDLGSKLKLLKLNDNSLRGEIPATLGQLTQLQTIWLHKNGLTGHVPSQLGGLSSLRRLNLSDNPGLTGELPQQLKNLSSLNTFWFLNTDLCVPPNAAFQAWLAGLNVKPQNPPICEEENLYDYYIYDEWGGFWHDADQGDSSLCWAAAASNILAWTDWYDLANAAPPTAVEEDIAQDIFNVFPVYWNDPFGGEEELPPNESGGLMEFAWEWWFTGDVQELPPGDDWSTFTPGSGNYFPSIDLADFKALYRYSGFLNAVPAIQVFLHSRYGVTVTAYPPDPDSGLGHAFTVWGYQFMSDTSDVTGLWMTDSDDELGLFFLPVTYNGASKFWAIDGADGDYSIYNGWNIEGVMALAHNSLTGPETVTIWANAIPGGMAQPAIDPIGSVEVAVETDQIFTITSSPDYPLHELLVDGASADCVSTEDPNVCTYTFEGVTEDHTIQAIFTSDSLPAITASADSNGKITPAGTIPVEFGGDQSFNISPDLGYRVKDVVVDNQSTGPAYTYTFENVTEDHTVDAQFVENVVRLAIIEKKCVDVDGVTEIECGSTGSNGVVADGTFQVADQECDLDCDMIVVSFSEYSSLIMKSEPDSESFFLRWEQGDGTTVEGLVDSQEDVYLRPVFGCSGG